MKNTVILCLVFVLNSIFFTKACNEVVCAPVVSKCLLIKSCNCDTQNHTCSALCFTCLGKLFTECCSCVDLCPKDEEKVLDKLSTVVENDESVPELFNALIEVGDRLMHWTAETFENSYTTSRGDLVSINCSVIWWDQCVSFKKCKDQCISMGAASIRMFHNGCCECVGDTCVHYGRNESKCRHCPFNGNSDEYPLTQDDDMEGDYGEESEYEDN